MPTTGNNLSLNQLAAATGQAVKGLSNAAGGTGPNINISHFTITGVTTPTWNVATVAYGGNFTASGNFSGAGSRFGRISSRDANFTWGTTPAGSSVVSTAGFQRTFNNAYNPGGTSCSSSAVRTVTLRFNDGFNDDATNYNATLVTGNITLYSPPAPSFSVTGKTQPPRPCNTGGGCGGLCRGASISVSSTAGNWQGVAGGSVNYYINGGFAGSNGGGGFTYTNLCGNTLYSLYVQNSYSCNSSTQNVTTPAYI